MLYLFWFNKLTFKVSLSLKGGERTWRPLRRDWPAKVKGSCITLPHSFDLFHQKNETTTRSFQTFHYFLHINFETTS